MDTINDDKLKKESSSRVTEIEKLIRLKSLEDLQSYSALASFLKEPEVLKALVKDLVVSYNEYLVEGCNKLNPDNQIVWMFNKLINDLQNVEGTIRNLSENSEKLNKADVVFETSPKDDIDYILTKLRFVDGMILK